MSVYRHVPQELKELSQWVVWKEALRGDQMTKLPYQVNGDPAKSNDPATWTTFDVAVRRFRQGGCSGIGFVFSEQDDFVGIDLDGCRNPKTGEFAEWAREILKSLDSYSEVSPSQTGAKIFCRGDWPFASGKKVSLENESKVSDKNPGIEVYSQGRYFAVTGIRLSGLPVECKDRSEALRDFASRWWPENECRPAESRRLRYDDEAAVIERARKYVSAMPPAVSGQRGHDTTYSAACVLVLGFGLSPDDAFVLLSEWNSACQPPWTDKELWHKIHDASKEGGERNYLRNASRESLSRVRVPSYRCPKPEPEIRRTTLEESANKYLESTRDGKTSLLDLGLPDVDYAIGGGVERGEMIILAARPGHGKSATALQAVHVATANGMPALIISEEMSAIALGKRAIQFASEVPEEHWRTSADEVAYHVASHFRNRATCYVAECCRTAERAAETIREHVKECGVQFVVVDYAQLLGSRGNGRYEQITNTSIALRQVTSECNIVTLVLCQLNRSIENRSTFAPVMSDLKDTGQLEQDADVILFMVWPHRIDSSQDANLYQFFVAKNRNRGINRASVECKFLPSRQMFLDYRDSGGLHSDELSRLGDYF